MIRKYEVTIIKKGNQFNFRHYKKDSTFKMKYEWRINRLKPIALKNENNEFENYFVQTLLWTKARTGRSRETTNDTSGF